MLARILALIGIPTWMGPLILAGLVVAGLAGVYGKGYHDASASCRAAEIRAQLDAANRLAERYRNEAQVTASQRALEALDAASREKLLNDRITSLKAVQDLSDTNETALEADLAALTKDKEKLNALIDKFRKSRRMDCRAGPDDVAVDNRVYQHGK